MIRILFLSLHGSNRSQMAHGFAGKLIDSKEVVIVNAGMTSKSPDPLMVKAMAEAGIDISNQPNQALADLDSTAFDLVIALSEQAHVDCSLLPGTPAMIRWDIADPIVSNNINGRNKHNEEEMLVQLRQTRDEIQRRVEDFFRGGYLPATVTLKHNSEMILDHFTDGIIAHDSNRRITWFNRAAERITGYDRRDVIGRKCDDIFNGGFCGEKCSFCEGVPNFDKINYPLKITTKDGSLRQVEMTIVALRDDKKNFQGVLASFHDITEVTQLRRKLKDTQSFHGIIGGDEKMQMIYDLVSDLSGSDCPVLIQGESGTGKELIAGAIHGEGNRSGQPFVTINCGALPEGILESELFGHVRGAFTGAVRDKKGRFELADQGTLFLDEIGELSPNIQVKLLRVLQEHSFTRVGGEKDIKVDVRVISATNRDLREMVSKGGFREDLFYRICVVPINLPPLRERRNDIPLLVNHFVDRFSKDLNRSIEGVSPEVTHCMIDYRWPGNIRELQNAIQYAFVKCKISTIQLEHLPPELLTFAGQERPVAYRRRGKLDSARVEQAMTQAKGNKVKAAKILDVGRATLYRFLKEYGRA